VQIFAHGLLAAAAVDPSQQFRELFKSPEFQRVAVVLAGLFVIGQVFTIFAHFIASKAVADKDDATVRNGFRVWLYHIIFGFFWGVGLALLVPMASRDEQLRLLMLSGGMVLLGILIIFLVPMKIYRIGFWASFGMLLLSGFIQSTAMTAVSLAALYSPFSGPHLAALHKLIDQKVAEQVALSNAVLGKEAPDEIDRLLDEALGPAGMRKPLPEREAAVRAIQDKLQVRQRALAPTDTDAAVKFKRQLDRYKRLVEDVKAERNATHPARTN
jgi:hypothetical protein